MSFISSLEAVRRAYTISRFASQFIFAAEDVVCQIGSNELRAAKHSLEDMKSSNNPQRELNMAITQLRSALEHFDSKRYSLGGLLNDWEAMERSYKTSLLIAVCYASIGESLLSQQFRKKSIEYFEEWLDNYQRPQGKIWAQNARYDMIKKKVITIGLSWPYSYPQRNGLFDDFSSKKQKLFDDALRDHKKSVVGQFVELSQRLTNL